MIEINRHSDDGLISIKVSRKLTEADYYKILPLLLTRSHHLKKKGICFQFETFQEWEYMILLRHVDAFEKVAIVGRQNCHHWVTEVIESTTTAEAKYFNTSQSEDAWTWVTNSG